MPNTGFDQLVFPCVLKDLKQLWLLFHSIQRRRGVMHQATKLICMGTSAKLNMYNLSFQPLSNWHVHEEC
jgi:hypothetical protein